MNLRQRFGRALRLGVIGGGPASWIGAMHRSAAELDGWFQVCAGVFSSDTAAFLLVKMVLHPSAWRWGGLPHGTFIGMIAVFVVFLVGAVAFWAWFNLRAAPDDETPHDLDDDRMTEDGLIS